jgi:TPR repeat protein
MKANPLACALLVLLAIAVQLPAQQPATNAAGTNLSDWEPVSSSGTNIFDQFDRKSAKTNDLGFVPDWAMPVAAAKRGDATAQFNLGCWYLKGDGVLQDYSEALNWFRKAAEQGNAPAQCNLGWMYDTGKGVQQNYTEAYKWYNLAAAQGETNAIHNRDRIVPYMTPDQIAEGQRQSVAFVARKELGVDSVPPNVNEIGTVVTAPVKSALPEIMMAVVLIVFLLIAGVIFARRVMKQIGAQKFILLCGMLMVVLCGLFPPWQYTADRNGAYGYHSHNPAGYQLLFAPPTNPDRSVGHGVQIDFGRLFLEWAALAVVTGMVWVIVIKPARQRDDKANRSQKPVPPTSNPEN